MYPFTTTWANIATTWASETNDWSWQLSFSDTKTKADSLVRSLSKSFSEVLTKLDIFSRQISIARTFTATVTKLDTLSRLLTITRSISDTMHKTDSLIRSFTRSVRDVLIKIDTYSGVKNQVPFIFNIAKAVTAFTDKARSSTSFTNKTK